MMRAIQKSEYAVNAEGVVALLKTVLEINKQMGGDLLKPAYAESIEKARVSIAKRLVLGEFDESKTA